MSTKHCFEYYSIEYQQVVLIVVHLGVSVRCTLIDSHSLEYHARNGVSHSEHRLYFVVIFASINFFFSELYNICFCAR